MDARQSVSPAAVSSGQELFDFFELFGDPSSTAATANQHHHSNEALLSGDDQLMFASFLDAFDAGGPAPTPSLDLFGNVVGASDLLSLTASSTSSAASSNLSSGIRSLNPRFSPAEQPNPASDSLTIPVLSSPFTAPHEHKSALFPLHNPSNPFAAQQQQQGNHAEDGFEDQLSGSLPKRMKSNNTASAPTQPFNFLTFYQQQLAAAQLLVQQAQQAQQQAQQQQQQQLPLPQQLLHQLQQSQQHNLQQQQQQQQQHHHHHHYEHQQPQAQNPMDPYASNMMPPLASFQPLMHHDAASQPPSTPSPPPTAQLHSTSSLLAGAASSSSLASASSLSNTITSASLNSTIPKKRGRKPKDSIKADPDSTIPAANSASAPSSSAKANKPLLSASEKKANHIQAEQRRRAQIRDALRELSQMVPGLLPPIDGDTTVEGSSRVEILEGTRRYVEVLIEGNARLRRRLMEA